MLSLFSEISVAKMGCIVILILILIVIVIKILIILISILIIGIEIRNVNELISKIKVWNRGDINVCREQLGF